MAQQVEIADATLARMRAFQQVVEAVIEERLGFDAYVELLLQQAMNSMLRDLLGPLDPTVLLQSFEQLSASHPEEVYGFVARTLKAGEMADAQAKVRRQIGFGHRGEATGSSL